MNSACRRRTSWSTTSAAGCRHGCGRSSRGRTEKRLVPWTNGRTDATTAKPRDGDPRHGSAGGALRDPLIARKRLQQQAEGEERSAPSSQGSWHMAPRWSWASTRVEEEGMTAKGDEVWTQLAT